MAKPSNRFSFDLYVCNMSRFEHKPFVKSVDGAVESSPQ